MAILNDNTRGSIICLIGLSIIMLIGICVYLVMPKPNLAEMKHQQCLSYGAKVGSDAYITCRAVLDSNGINYH